MMQFFLGTHMPHWLATADFPLFVSHRRLKDRKTLPVARTGWALDSGGFTELTMFGAWTTPPEDYVKAVSRYRDEIGSLDWASPQDWMCEPFVTDKTGKTVTEHQRLTVENYLTLRDLDASLPFVPVLQGWEIDDYRRHVDAYTQAGVDLLAETPVGVGSVCRRQHTGQIERLLSILAADGLQLHGFGLKLTGLRAGAQFLRSADSMAWSYQGRRRPVMCGSTTHKSEANCLTFATRWRERVLDACATQQLPLFGAAS